MAFCWRIGTCHFRSVSIHRILGLYRIGDNNIGNDSSLRVGFEQSAGLYPPLTVAYFAYVYDFARLQRNSVQQRGDFRMWIIAGNLDIDSA